MKRWKAALIQTPKLTFPRVWSISLSECLQGPTTSRWLEGERVVSFHICAESVVPFHVCAVSLGSQEKEAPGGTKRREQLNQKRLE